jgi:hypothetical protein
MQSGNRVKLPKSGLRGLLKELGSPDAYGNPPAPITGEIKVFGKTRNGSVFLKNGRIYSAQLDEFVPPIARRLLSTGLISEVMFNAMAKLPPSEVASFAIANEYVDEDVLEDIHRQMLFATLTHMYEWRDASWEWHRGAKSKSYTMYPLEISLAISATDERMAQWIALVHNHSYVTKGNSVVSPGEDWVLKAGEETTPEIASILRYVNSENTVADIALACGFSRFEIASRLAKAVADGLVLVTNPDLEDVSTGSIESLLHSREEEYQEAEELVLRLRESLAEAEERLELARKNLER